MALASLVCIKRNVAVVTATNAKARGILNVYLC